MPPPHVRAKLVSAYRQDISAPGGDQAYSDRGRVGTTCRRRDEMSSPSRRLEATARRQPVGPRNSSRPSIVVFQHDCPPEPPGLSCAELHSALLFIHIHRRKSLPHLASIGTSATEFAASIARYSGRASSPVGFALRNSLRCRAPRIGLARDSSRANGDRERQAPISTRRTAPDVPR